MKGISKLPQRRLALNPQQEAAVNYAGGPLLIAAGAGSGKTRTLTSRLLRLVEAGVPPEGILAITFTNKAAQEMRARITDPPSLPSVPRNQHPFIGTFHALGARILRAEGGHFGRTASYTIYDQDDKLSLLKKITGDMNLDRERYHPVMFQNIISRTKDELLLEPTDAVARAVFERYEETLHDSNAFDFDDLIQKVVLLLQEQPAVLRRYQQRWQHILVDEFQDVNTSQYALVKLLAQEHRNLAVVGDDAQSIFKFRGADFRNFLNFEKDWPTATVVLLEENYRSTTAIIQAANSVIKNNQFQKPKTLWTKNSAGDLITVIGAASDDEEAAWVVEKTMALVRMSIPPETIAILYRTNAQSRALEQNLIAAGVSYTIFGGIRFYDRKEIKDVVAALRFAHNPQDTVSAERLGAAVSKKILGNLLETLPQLGKELAVLEIINYFLTATRYLEQLRKRYQNAQERIENINELIAFSGTFGDYSPRNLADFLEQVSLATSADGPRGEDRKRPGVNLMTIHLAKGLEFNTVFVVGCDEGTLPHHRSYHTAEELEEERRLMYVAMTRARRQLFLAFSKNASRFLYEIPPELVEFTSLGKQRASLDEEEKWIEYE